uniref:Uncharacterized protein n=1 Tax=Sphaerodactylus townsendi TaxID=933632 RepID=A0ACB8FCV9_9SAUR
MLKEECIPPVRECLPVPSCPTGCLGPLQEDIEQLNGHMLPCVQISERVPPHTNGPRMKHEDEPAREKPAVLIKAQRKPEKTELCDEGKATIQ